MTIIHASSLAKWLMLLSVTATASSSSSSQSIVSTLASNSHNDPFYFDTQEQCPPEKYEWYNFNLYFSIRSEIPATRDVGNGQSRSIPNPDVSLEENEKLRLDVRPYTSRTTVAYNDGDTVFYGPSNLVLQFVPNSMTTTWEPLNVRLESPQDLNDQEGQEVVEGQEADDGAAADDNNNNRNRNRQRQRQLQPQEGGVDGEGWTLAASYLLERGETTLFLNHTTTSEMATEETSSSTIEGSFFGSSSSSSSSSSSQPLQPIGMTNNYAIWFCEVVEFHFAPPSGGDPAAAGGSASVTLYDFMIAPYFTPKYGWDIPEPSCELPVVPACADPQEICHAVNGQYRCVERPTSSMDTTTSGTTTPMLRSSNNNPSSKEMVHYDPPIAGLSRDEYLEKYHCVKYGSPLTAAQADIHQSFLYWVAGGSFLQASNAQLLITQEGSSVPMPYKFHDQFDREPVLYSGSVGNLLERAEQWRENDQQRRIIFYFDPNDDPQENDAAASDPTGVETAAAVGWTMTKLWVYNDQFNSQTQRGTADWVYAKMDGVDISVPSSNSVFYCQEMEFELNVKDYSLYADYSTGTGGVSFTHQTTGAAAEESQFAGKFTMEHVYLMAYQDTELVENTACALEKIYNPCDQYADVGHSYCHATNGQVSCLDGPGGTALGQQGHQDTVGTEEDGEVTIADEDGQGTSPRAFGPGTSLDAASFSSATLLCQKPDLESSKGTYLSSEDLPNVTLNWQTEASYLFASHANVIYPANGGTAVQFQDQLGRDTCLSSPDDDEKVGSQLGRGSFWWEGNVERRLSFDFEEYIAEDEFPLSKYPLGWSLTSTKVYQNEYQPEYLSESFPKQFENNNGIIGAPENMLFYCDYVEFEYKNPISGAVDATFSSWDFVLGSYMTDLPNSAHDDICNWPVYNPCLEESSETSRMCRFEKGALSCHAEVEGDNFLQTPGDISVSRSSQPRDASSRPTLGSLGVGPCRPPAVVEDDSGDGTSTDPPIVDPETPSSSARRPISFAPLFATLTIMVAIGSI